MSTPSRWYFSPGIKFIKREKIFFVAASHFNRRKLFSCPMLFYLDNYIPLLRVCQKKMVPTSLGCSIQVGMSVCMCVYLCGGRGEGGR